MKHSTKVFWFWWVVGMIISTMIFFSQSIFMAASLFLTAIFCFGFGEWLSKKEKEEEFLKEVKRFEWR